MFTTRTLTVAEETIFPGADFVIHASDRIGRRLVPKFKPGDLIFCRRSGHVAGWFHPERNRPLHQINEVATVPLLRMDDPFDPRWAER
jgi:hypothetical protein